MASFKAKFTNENTFKASFKSGSEMKAGFGNVQVVETSNYDNLTNKPSYNGVVWEGNKTFADVGDYNLSNIQIKAIFDKVFKKGD